MKYIIPFIQIKITDSHSVIECSKILNKLYRFILLFVIPFTFIGCKEQKTDLLSPEERAWINQLDGELIHAPDPFSPPMEFFDSDSIFKGMTADYLDIISERLDIKIKTVQLNDWSEVVQKAKSYEIDFSTAVQNTISRHTFWNFTTPYFNAPNVIILTNSAENNINVEDLTNKKVAIVNGYAVSDFMQDQYSENDYIVVSNVTDALKLVSFSDVDATIIHLSAAAYYTEKLGFTHLKVGGDIGYSYNFTYASRNDWPILNQILQKGLNAIPPKEKQEIHDRWVSIRIVPIWQRSSFWSSLLLICLLFVFLFWLVFFLKKKNKALKIATEQAHAANEAKSEFLANMSHEIRTPMNAIIGFTSIISEMNEDEKQQEFLDIIQSSGESLLNIINDILDLSKIEAGKIDLKTEETSLKKITTEIEAFFALKTQLKGLSLIVENEGVDIIYTDPLRLKQVLINIVGNAVKFTNEGYIKITIVSDTKMSDANLSNIYITIEDTGIGIPETQMCYIFEAFSQAKNNDTTKHVGTGLGLAITKRLMEMMDGSIVCQSEEGKGTKFTLSLNNVKVIENLQPNTNQTSNELTPVRFRKASILIYDDTNLTESPIKEVLSEFTFNITHTTNSSEALDIISSEMPDLLIIDTEMPVVNYEEILKKLHQIRYYKKIPIIIILASATNEFEDSGFDSFMKKPITKSDLIKEFKKYLN